MISGHGSTTVTTEDGRKHSFEWGPKSLFSIPLNATYQHFNVSGLEPARLASTNNMVYAMNRFRNEKLIYDCPVQFPERAGGDNFRRRRRIHRHPARPSSMGDEFRL